MIHSIAQMCVPRQRLFDIAFLFILHSKAFCGVLVRDEREAYLHHIMLLSQNPDPRTCMSYTLIKIVQVCGILKSS